MNRYFRFFTLLVAAFFSCLLSFVLETQAQNRQTLSKNPNPPHGRMKPGLSADPRLRMLAQDSAATVEQEAWHRSLPPHLQNLPPQMLAKMPWLQPDKTKRPDLPRDLHSPEKFNRPWEQRQDQLKRAQPLSKIAAAPRPAQIMSSCLSEDWVARYNEPGISYDFATAMGIDGDGNIYVTGLTSAPSGSDYLTVKYNAAGVLQWKARYNGPAGGSNEAFALAADGSGSVYVTGYSSNFDFTTDYATIKYNAAGVQQWEARYIMDRQILMISPLRSQ